MAAVVHQFDVVKAFTTQESYRAGQTEGFVSALWHLAIGDWRFGFWLLVVGCWLLVVGCWREETDSRKGQRCNEFFVAVFRRD